MSHPHTNAKPVTGPFKITAISLACLMLVSHPDAALAASIPLMQKPVGTGSMQPAPNVIITVDDSGSMAWELGGGNKTSKITLLKESLKKQFGDGTANSGKVPDKRIRLAWQSMHNNGSAPGAGTLTPGKENAMRSFEGPHRKNFNTFVDSLKADNGTPSLRMMRQAHDYMRTPEGINSPWADSPGTKQSTPYMACRRSYHVFMTDGAWNSQSLTDDQVALGDSKDRTLPDGTVYSAKAIQSRIYKDNYGDKFDDRASTFSDFAFNSWATDLQGGMDNSVKPLTKKEGVEKFETPACVSAKNCVETQEYWNPKNDPATWQHMNTYTIGFGLGAVNWDSTATTPVDWDTNNTSRDNYGGDFATLVQGAKVWPDVETENTKATPEIRSVELWHGALNGRGKYYPAKTEDDLTQAFAAIMDTINADTSKPLVSIAASSSTLETGLNAFIAGYDATKWKGSLGVRPINSSTGSIGTTDTWNVATLLDAIDADKLANRFVFSYGAYGGKKATGINWKKFDDLPAAQKDQLNRDSSKKVDDKGPERVAYLRGDRSKEASKNGGIFRDRDSRLGDIVNSNIWYTGKPASGYSMNGYYAFRSNANGGKGGRTPMIYVGANDGMLHGFAASNGTELMAYIPQGIAEGDLRKLTDTTYDHQYFVDGSPFTGDAFIGTTPAWTTVLVGTLGAGGKGYFVLDVTDPNNFTVANAGALVLTDTTKSSDPDLGHIISPPLVDSAVDNKSRQIVKMNSPKGGRWAVVLGNGYNSKNEAPVLVVQYLDGDKEIKKLSPCDIPVENNCSANYKGNGNGLSTPQAIDLNGDGKVDIAYAGDLKGNLWKFNLTDADDSKWSVAFSAQPFFMARPTTTSVQSITTAPYWMQHPLGGIMLAIGTGQNLANADRSSTTTESIYALYDNSTFSVSVSAVTLKDTDVINNATSSPSLPTSLVQQSVTKMLTKTGTNYYESTAHPVVYTGGSPKRGWYLNWSVPGQRVLHNISAFSGEKILVRSTVPASSTGAADVETCSPPPLSERGFTSVFNMFTGNPPKDPPFGLKDATTAENGPGDGFIARRRIDGKYFDVKLTPDSTDPTKIKDPSIIDPGSYTGMRANWRATQ